MYVRPRGIGLFVDRPALLGGQFHALTFQYRHKGLAIPQAQTRKSHLSRGRVEFHRRATRLEVELERRMESDLLKVLCRAKALVGIPGGVVARVAPVPQIALWQIETDIHKEGRQAAGDILEQLHGDRSIGVCLGGADCGLFRAIPVVWVVEEHLGHVAQTNVLGQLPLTFETTEVKALVLVHHSHGQIEPDLGLEGLGGKHLAIVQQPIAQQILEPSQTLFHFRLVYLVLHNLDQPQLVNLACSATEGLDRGHQMEVASFHAHGVAAIQTVDFIAHRGDGLGCP